MKKLFFSMCVVLLFMSQLHARSRVMVVDSNELGNNIMDIDVSSRAMVNTWGTMQTAIASTRTVSALTVYTTVETTTTAATYKVFASSMAFITTGGLYPGTTYVGLAETNTDTINELVDFLNAMSVGTLGIGGGLTATLVNGCYDQNVSTGLAVNHTAVSIFNSTSTSTITFDTDNAIYGMSYTISAPTGAGEKIVLTNVDVSATFASGTSWVYIYDGDETTDTILKRYEINTTATPTEVPLPDEGLAGTANTALRVDIWGTAIITDGYYNINYTLKH